MCIDDSVQIPAAFDSSGCMPPPRAGALHAEGAHCQRDQSHHSNSPSRDRLLTKLQRSGWSRGSKATWDAEDGGSKDRGETFQRRISPAILPGLIHTL